MAKDVMLWVVKALQLGGSLIILLVCAVACGTSAKPNGFWWHVWATVSGWITAALLLDAVIAAVLLAAALFVW